MTSRITLLFGAVLAALFMAAIAGAAPPTISVSNVTVDSWTVTVSNSGLSDPRPCGKTYETQVRTVRADGTKTGWRAAPAVTTGDCPVQPPPPPPPPPPPSGLQFVTPTAGSTVSGVVTVDMTESDPSVTWIWLGACDGAAQGELAKQPDGHFRMQWDTTQPESCPGTTTTLDAISFNGGNQVHETTETVTIAAAPPPPPPPPPPPGSCPDSTVPAPISGQGYTTRFTDCFDNLDRSTWCSHQWWESPPPLDSQSVDTNGVLHLTRRAFEGFANTTISTEPCGQANPHSYQYGYFEARMKWDAAQGNGPSFWLFSTRHATNPSWPNVNPYCANNGLPVAQCWSAELDAFEGYGSHPDVFTGTLHRNSCNCYGVQDTQTGNNWQPRGVNIASDWHTYGVLWTPSLITWYLDGVPVMSDPPYDSTPQPMHLLFYNWTTDWQADNQPGPVATLDTQVDWVRVWQQ